MGPNNNFLIGEKKSPPRAKKEKGKILFTICNGHPLSVCESYQRTDSLKK